MKEKLNARIIIIYALVIGLGLICLLPLWNIVAISLSGSAAVAGNKVGLIPIDLTFGAYQKIMGDGQFWRSFGISVLRVVVTLALNLILIVLMAYPLAKSKRAFKGRSIYMNILIFAMLFNGGMIPTYLVVKQLGLLNTIWALILPGAVPIFSVILVMNFFRGIPKALEEAAIIDGATPLQVLFQVFIPISLPSLATVSLFSIVGTWNDFMGGLIYITTAENYPLMTYIQALNVNIADAIKNNASAESIANLAQLSDKNLNAAKIMVAIIPLLLIYPMLQKYFVTGMVVGSVKE